MVSGKASRREPPDRGPAVSRREYVACLALGTAGAVLTLLCLRQGWARVLTAAPSPLPATSVSVTGQDLVPLAGALGLASLAGLAAVAATRHRTRRLVGLLLAAFGVAMLVSMWARVGTADVLAAARAAAVPPGGSATAGGVSGAAGAVPGGTPGVTAPGQVTLAGFPWRPLAMAGAAMVAAAGLLGGWRGGRWPVMSSRYERPATGEPVPAADSATLWEELSSGADPTDPA